MGQLSRAKILTFRKKTLIERAYTLGEMLGIQVWCEDEAGPYQTIPLPGFFWKPEGQSVHQAHQYIRGKTAKFLTLFRPATGELRAKPVDHSTNAILHPWLKEELEAILKHCPSAPKEVREGSRWQNWDIYPSADQLDRWFPPFACF